MTWSTLQDVLYGLVNKWMLGLTVIWAEQSQPRPALPYCTLKSITGGVRVGDDDHLQRDQVWTLEVSNTLVANDVITGKVDDREIEVAFSASHGETMRLLCAAIRQGRTYYAKVDRLNPNLIKIRSFDEVVLTAWEIETEALDEEGDPVVKTIAVVEVRDTDGTQLSGMRRVTVSMNVYGQTVLNGVVTATAMDLIERFYNVMSLPAFLDDARQLEIGVVGADAPQNLTEALDTSYEDRAQLDFYIHVPFEMDSLDGLFIESAKIDKV